MTFYIAKDSPILVHEWIDNLKIPDGFQKRTAPKKLSFPAKLLIQNPLKGTGGWTKIARDKGIGGKMIRDNMPYYGKALHVEFNYFIFQADGQLGDAEVDLIMIHKSYVTEKNR